MCRLLSFVACALLSGAFSAQARATPPSPGTGSGGGHASGRLLVRPRRPLETAHLDLATGTLTRGATVHLNSQDTVSDFPTSTSPGCSPSTRATASRVVRRRDQGQQRQRHDERDRVRLLLVHEGPQPRRSGGSVKLGFYEGYVTGGGTPMTAVAVSTLTGLPSSSNSSSFFGGFSCYFLSVSFSAGRLPGWTDRLLVGVPRPRHGRRARRDFSLPVLRAELQRTGARRTGTGRDHRRILSPGNLAGQLQHGVGLLLCVVDQHGHPRGPGHARDLRAVQRRRQCNVDGVEGHPGELERAGDAGTRSRDERAGDDPRPHEHHEDGRVGDVSSTFGGAHLF